MFDLWQLRALRELSRRGTMAAVAAAFSLTPSAVSQQLAALERAAGVRLIEPDGRRVRLTAAGRVLAERADSILLSLRDAADEVAAVGEDASGVLRLAAFPSVAAALCPAVFRGVAERHPRHRVTLTEGEPEEAVTAIGSGEVDLAIVDEPALPAGSDIAADELLADPLYCVLPAGHRLAHKRKVYLRDLAEESWIMDHPTCSFYRATMDLCLSAGFAPNAVASTESVSVATALVSAGAGVAILPGLALASAADVVYRPITPGGVRRLYAAYRPGANERPSMVTALSILRDRARALAKTVAALARP
jgi:DNA-binding transcriptional LysR family regulator